MKMLRLISVCVVALGFSAMAMATTYEVKPSDSRVHWKGSKVGSSHDGTVGIKSGNITLEGTDLKSLNVVIDMQNMTNDDLSGEWRDKLLAHLKNDDFFAVDKFPESKIVSTKVESLGNNKFKVTGDMTIKDKTQEVVFDVDLATQNNNLTGKTKFTFDRTKYGVQYNSGSFFKNLGDKLILDDVEMTVDIVASKK
jgi:polyisoprenoid-binding protein YceI